MVGLVERLGPFEVHRMPNGDQVYYRDSDHTYHSSIRESGGKWVGKGRWGDLPSPSSIAKYADPNPDRLMEYAARKTREGVVALGTLGENWTADDLNTALKSQKLTWRDNRDSKGDIGTLAHWAFEQMLEGIRVKVDELPEGARGYAQGAADFLRDLGEYETLQREAVVYSKQYQFAGRFDARVEVPLSAHGGQTVDTETWLVDLKTSGFIGRSYHNQLAGYDLAAEECGYGASDRIVIVQLLPEPDDKGRTYIPWPCRGTREGFLNNLTAYNDGKRLDALMKQDWKELVA